MESHVYKFLWGVEHRKVFGMRLSPASDIDVCIVFCDDDENLSNLKQGCCYHIKSELIGLGTKKTKEGTKKSLEIMIEYAMKEFGNLHTFKTSYPIYKIENVTYITEIGYR